MGFNLQNLSDQMANMHLDSGMELSYPQSIQQWNGKTITMDTPQACFLKYGIYPGTILKDNSAHKLLQVEGMQKDSGLLWVKTIESYPLSHIHSQASLQKEYKQMPSLQEKQSLQREWVVNDSKRVNACMMQVFVQTHYSVIFQVDHEQIKAHTELLASRSNYFKKILESGSQESNLNNSSIRVIPFSDAGVKAEELRAIFNYLQTGYIVINRKNVARLADLAYDFVISDLLNYCQQAFSQMLEPEDALNWLNELSTPQSFLKPIVESYIYRSLSLICEKSQKEIQSLSKEDLIDLFHKAPDDKAKIAFFEVVVIWLLSPDFMQFRIACAEDVITLFPKNEQMFFRYGRILSQYLKGEQKEKFANCLKFASNTWIVFIYAEALLFLDKAQEAHVVFFNLQSWETFQPFAAIKCAHTLQILGRLEDAKTMYEIILKSTKLSSVIGGYARTLQLMGYKDLAKQKFEEALEINPDNVQVLTDYGILLSSQGKIEEALKKLTRALELDDKNCVAKEMYYEINIPWTVG